MTYADDPDNGPQEVNEDTPARLGWPNLPTICVTLGTILGWFRAWRA